MYKDDCCRRENILSELLDTEERYVADLHSVLIGYRFVFSFLIGLFKRARAFITQV